MTTPQKYVVVLCVVLAVLLLLTICGSVVVLFMEMARFDAEYKA